MSFLKNIDDGCVMSKEALALHILGMERDGDIIPVPTDPVELTQQAGSFYSLVEAYLPPLREKRANRSVNNMVNSTSILK